MSKHYNNLTPAEAERIAILMEECGEVIQACGKILRHGYESYNPHDPAKVVNRIQLSAELGDLLYSIEDIESDINLATQQSFYTARQDKLKKYTHHQG